MPANITPAAPAFQPAIPDLRSVLLLRLRHHGREWRWLADARHHGHRILKRPHLTYPRDLTGSHRKSSLPTTPCWASLLGAACNLQPATVAALVLAWQWETFRANQLSREQAGKRWPASVRLPDALANHPPTVADLARFEAGRTLELERDLNVAFRHEAVAQEYGMYLRSVRHLAHLAVTQRWHTKPIFDQNGCEAPHLASAAPVPDARRERRWVLSVPKVDAIEGLCRVMRLAQGARTEPLTYDWLCDLGGFGRRELAGYGEAAHRRDVLFQCGLMATFRDDMVAVMPRDGGPLRFGLYDLAVPDPDAVPTLARQVAAHPWRATDMRCPVSFAPMGLMVHRPVADLHPVDAGIPEESPILLTFLWRACVGRDADREPPAPRWEGMRWRRIADLYAGGLPDFADRVILASLRHQHAMRVIEEGSAQLVDFSCQDQDSLAWKKAWTAA